MLSFRTLRAKPGCVKKLPSDFVYLPEMRASSYFPPHLVDKVRDAIRDVVTFIEAGGRSKEQIQEKLDAMTERINDLQSEFEDAGSEIETGARESIGDTVGRILEYFQIDIDVETAIGARDW